MKTLVGKIGLILRLGAMAGVLLFTQQAMAIGTAAGTAIDNTVTVDYDVNGVDQTDLTDSVRFVVDRRVDFTLSLVGGALVDVTPGQTPDAFFDLLLTNDSNSPLDFNLVLDQAGVTTVRGVGDTADMTNARYAVSTDFVGNTPPVETDPQFVDELPADEDVIIRVWGEAALTLLSGQVAGIQIDATAAEPNTVGEGAALVDGVANTDLGIENVFADAGTDGVESQTDGFIVVTADLAVTKSYAIIAGDLGSGLPIPGATIEYTITVVNSSATDADAVNLVDDIDADTTQILNIAAAPYGGNDVYVDNEGTQLACNIEDNADGDGCDLVGATMTIGSPDLAAGITVAGNTTLTIQYQVLIPDPDPTP